MDRFLDEAARILAGQTPRRQALRLLGGALAGALVAAFTTRRAGAAGCTPTSCPSGQKCCTTASPNFCVPTANTCCGSTSCASGIACCGGKCCKVGQGCVSGRCGASAA